MSETTLSELLQTKFSEETIAGYLLERRLSDIGVQAAGIVQDCGLSRREIAARMGLSSPSTVQRLVREGAHNATLETLFKFAHACGYAFEASFVPLAAPAALTNLVRWHGPARASHEHHEPERQEMPLGMVA